jgi:hypothetical protein
MSNHPYTFNLKKEEEVPDETQDPAYKAGLRMGESVLEFFLGLLLLPFLIWIAWNITMPFIFGLPSINWVHSVGLYILSRLLIK